MQTKRNIRSKVSDVLVVLICLAGMSITLKSFWDDLNQTLTRINEKPIATITFKYKSAQRRFTDRVLWDRLKQESPIYSGDTIRTASQSEATITFLTGDVVIQMYENTLAQVFATEDAASFDFSSGGVSVQTGKSAASKPKEFTLSSGQNKVVLAEDSKIVAGGSAAVAAMPSGLAAGGQAAEPAGFFQFQVQQGSAQFNQDGSQVTVEQGSAVSLTAQGETITTPSLAVFSPRPLARILNSAKKDKTVSFSWTTVNLKASDVVQLEVARDKNFTQYIYKKDVSAVKSIDLDIPLGTTYWRLYALPHDSSQMYDESVVGGKINIVAAPPIEQIAPLANHEFAYRTKKPSVRFLWAENDIASHYQLVVADNPQLQNPVIDQKTANASHVTSVLEAGTWYWQVRPVYGSQYEGEAKPSVVSKFSIRKNKVLAAPLLSAPQHGSFTNIAKEQGFLYLSWKNEPEAQSYTLKISKNKDLSDPVIQEKTTTNYYSYDNKKMIISPGEWYWGVFQTDSEENNSDLSAVRAFLAVEGDVVYRTLFPPDNFQIARARVPDTRFTWQSNVMYGNIFQVSKSSTFSEIEYEQKVSTSSLSIPDLPEGSYYWRLTTDNEDELKIISQTKKFLVVPPLAKPSTTAPMEGKRVVVRENIPVEFKWKAVPSADYYQVKIFTEAGKAVYENYLCETTSIQFFMNECPETNYYWTIQAFSFESESSSRRSGVIQTATFNMKLLRPIDLLSPKNKINLNGLQSIRSPSLLSWKSVDRVKTSRLVVSKNPNPLQDKNPIMNITNPSTKVRMLKLPPGTYYWTVQGMTYDGLDVTARAPYSFTVLPVEKLPAPTIISPVNKTVYGPEQLKASRTVVFEWKKVASADAYIFKLYDSNKKVLIEQEQTDLSFVLKDLAVLARGDFSWTVEAIGKSPVDKIIDQRGMVSAVMFSINLPTGGTVKPRDPGTLYGR